MKQVSFPYTQAHICDDAFVVRDNDSNEEDEDIARIEIKQNAEGIDMEDTATPYVRRKAYTRWSRVR